MIKICRCLKMANSFGQEFPLIDATSFIDYTPVECFEICGMGVPEGFIKVHYQPDRVSLIRKSEIEAIADSRDGKLREITTLNENEYCAIETLEEIMEMM